MKGCVKLLLLAGVLLAAAAVPASAQSRRGSRTVVRAGLLPRPDSLGATTTDSLLMAVDSLRSLDPATRDSLLASGVGLVAIDSLASAVSLSTTDSLAFGAALSAVDSLAFPELASGLPADSLATDSDPLSRRKRGWLMNDSMSLSKVCWISTVLPGYGQIYNKQYWKLPILYGTLGASLGLFFHENSRYKPLKRQYNALTLESTDRSRELDLVQGRMIRSNTRRQIYIGAAIASYIYFIGDAAVNYSTNDVSDVKKATTLACICPGAGQIYNKSYWKVPFVVGGFASMIYCIDWNNRGYQRFKKAYHLLTEWEKAYKLHQDDPDRYPDPGQSKDEFRGRIPAKSLKTYKDSYRRNRDLCIIITAGLYVLQIVDAHVDAHLKDYDISDDLSMSLEPKIDYTYVPTAGGHRPVYGFNLSLNF